MTRPPSPTQQEQQPIGQPAVIAVVAATPPPATTSDDISSSTSNVGLATATAITANNSNTTTSFITTPTTTTTTTTTTNITTPFPFIPRTYHLHQQQQSITNTNTTTPLGQRFKATLPFPRLYSGPLFAAPSVSVNHTHIVSSIGPLTPPLTIDHSTSSPIPSCSTSDDLLNTHHKSIQPTTIATATNTITTSTNNHTTNNHTTTTMTTKTSSSTTKLPIASLLPPPTSSIKKQKKFNAYDVVHDVYQCMFRITLDNKGTIAALCYLPTRFQRMVEFYHTEIPIAYRDLGLGDLLVVQGFRWAETTKLLVIPTCPFVRRYLAKNNTNCDCVVENENEGLTRLFLTPPSPSVIQDNKTSSSLAHPIVE